MSDTSLNWVEDIVYAKFVVVIEHIILSRGPICTAPVVEPNHGAWVH